MSHPRSKASPAPTSQSQGDKFEKLARELECDEDPEAFKEKVRKIARAAKPPAETKQSE